MSSQAPESETSKNVTPSVTEDVTPSATDKNDAAVAKSSDDEDNVAEKNDVVTDGLNDAQTVAKKKKNRRKAHGKKTGKIVDVDDQKDTDDGGGQAERQNGDHVAEVVDGAINGQTDEVDDEMNGQVQSY
jgi:hypothetical protein